MSKRWMVFFYILLLVLGIGFLELRLIFGWFGWGNPARAAPNGQSTRTVIMVSDKDQAAANLKPKTVVTVESSASGGALVRVPGARSSPGIWVAIAGTSASESATLPTRTPSGTKPLELRPKMML